MDTPTPLWHSEIEELRAFRERLQVDLSHIRPGAGVNLAPRPLQPQELLAVQRRQQQAGAS